MEQYYDQPDKGNMPLIRKPNYRPNSKKTLVEKQQEELVLKPYPTLDESGEKATVNSISAKNIELFNLGRVDFNDPEAVKERTMQFFNIMAKYKAKPTLTSYGLALGIDRFTLSYISSGRYYESETWINEMPLESKTIIRNVYIYMNTIWEDYMVNGKINPVVGIFLGKNNFYYRDQIDQTVSIGPQVENFDTHDIRERYGQLDNGQSIKRLGTSEEDDIIKEDND